MFAEEEWADSPSADGPHQTVVSKVSSTPGKNKVVVGKRSLMRTLETLGSVPIWENEKPSGDSDEEKGESSTPTKTKKKRLKKRKRSSNVDNVKVEEKDSLHPPEPPAKKKKQQPVKKKKKETISKTLQSSIKEVSENGSQVEKEEIQTEQKTMSRKQWKNRMKNKRRCKNKYLQKTSDTTDNANTKEKPLAQPKDVPAKQKMQKSSKKMNKMKKPRLKNGITAKNDVENDKVLKSSINSDLLQSTTQAVCEVKGEMKTEMKTEIKNKTSCEVGDKVTPHKTTKQSQIRAEKLRNFLKMNHTEDSNTDKHIKEDPKNIPEKSEGDAETPPDRSSALRSKMEKRLEAARFRHINELLYTSTSGEAKRMFQQDPDAIGIYHRGYTAQVQHWPENPVDSIISYIRQSPSSLVVADFGCGDCKIAKSVNNKVHSFDLAPVCELAKACDMSKVPLKDSTVDIAVFCLSLMGTNLGDFLKEANRVLVMGGVLKIAEVASRFENVRFFTGAMSHLGFKLASKDTENSHFYSFEFIKTGNAPENVRKHGLQLKPCLYKKR